MQGQGQPDFPTISAFFGATRNASAPGGYSSSLAAERLPLNWRNRSKAFTLRDLITEIHHAYTTHYKLFGHNEELGNFVVDERQFPANGTVSDLICYLYDSITGRGLSGERYYVLLRKFERLLTITMSQSHRLWLLSA